MIYKGVIQKVMWQFSKKIFWQCAKVMRADKIIHLVCDLMIYAYYACFHGKKLLRMRVDSIEHYCMLNNENCIEIEPGCERLVYESPFWGLSEGKEHQFRSPSIYVAFMHNVFALGGTGMVLTSKDVLYDAIWRDEEHRIKLPWIFQRGLKHQELFCLINPDILEVDKAINLCGFGAGNYYHFTMEILSRFGYLKQIFCVENIPVLIDEKIKKYPQMEELLHIVIACQKIIYVPDESRVKVGTLIQLSMNTWMPMNVDSWNVFKVSDNLIAQSGIVNIRSCVKEYIKEQTQRKIYISRKKCDSSRLVNEQELIPIFEEAGFEIVYTECLSYLNQVELFSSARCVVGATGAALTNLLYCHQETIIGCIVPKEYNFYIYSTIAYFVSGGGKILFLNPDIVYKSACIASDQYQVNVEQCKKYIQELNKMCS